MSILRDRIDRLVDGNRGTISREIFVNQDIFDLEHEKIFGRSWLLVGHESLIPNPGDYMLSRMGKDSVIVTRNRQGTIHVLLNSCMHRGMKVCRYDQGNARAFTCPYHGWSYSTDEQLVDVPGQLVGVPGFEEYYKSELDKKQWGLVRCPNVVSYKGTIWANWDEKAPTFRDYIGNMSLYLDAALDCRDGRSGGSEVLGGIQKWRIKCNWKFAPENFIGDVYHDISHRSVDMVGITPGGGKGRRDAMRPNPLTIGFPKLGHGLMGWGLHDDDPAYVDNPFLPPTVDDYFRHIAAERRKNLGNKPRVLTIAGTIFPNMSFHGIQPRTIALFHPISPTEMEMWRMYLVDKDAPTEVKQYLRGYYLSYSGPGGLTESDDTENWSYATEASIGFIARQQPYNYQMGLGHSRPLPGIDGATECGTFTEANARIYYNRWLQFMQADNWSDIGIQKHITA